MGRLQHWVHKNLFREKQVFHKLLITNLLKVSFPAYSLMMNRITKSLNIVTILTKQRSKICY